MYDHDSIRTALRAKPGAVEISPFDATTLVAKIEGKLFALLPLTAESPQLSLKVDPGYGDVLRATYPAIPPGYHLNKQHWITPPR